MYYEAEHERRSQASKWKTREFELTRTISNLSETIELLHAELRRSKGEARSQSKAIHRMKQTLTDNNLPVIPTIMSLRLCVAENDTELCPLAMDTINKCSPPFEGCCLVLDPFKQDQRCAELKCGHRFNGVWLMFHFAKNQTFRCPICRGGKERFGFDLSVIPSCMMEALANKGTPPA